MLERYTILLLLFYGVFSLRAQESKQISSVKINKHPQIDGNLDDNCWKDAPVAGNFIQYEPYNKKKPLQKSEVKLVYDDRAIYFAFYIYDTSPDSILQELSKRDEDNVNTDYVAIDLCPFEDGINGYGFLVSAAGVQTDYKYSVQGKDYSWDAVWKSEVVINDKGWFVEIEIPYSAIRFPKKELQNWDINFWRQIRRNRERSTWNFIDKRENGTLTQMGKLTGIKSIEAPLRLSVTPYISAYLNKQSQYNNFGYSVNGGLDLKYGLNESFTLDMTLIPDFGQVQSDDKVLDLSPYETYYGEKRPFFTEGTELFSKGGIFYSRRIGGRPKFYNSVANEIDSNITVVNMPSETALINASKVTGRNKNGLGIGFFNAMTQQSNAEFEDQYGRKYYSILQPYTNYNMIVLDQSLNNNGYLSFVNTNVGMKNFSANVSGVIFKLANKRRSYAITGKGIISQKYEDGKLPDFGYTYTGSISKISGNFLFSASREVMSDDYDINDMGYLARNDKISNHLNLAYNIYDPFWRVLNWNNSINIYYNSLFDNNAFTSFEYSYRLGTTFKNYLSLGFNYSGSPIDRYDYFEPRRSGMYYTRSPYNSVSLWMSPDYRKKFIVDFNTGYTRENVFNKWGRHYTFGPRLRISDKALLVYSFTNNRTYDDVGYASQSDSVFFGKRDVKTIVNVIEGRYIFNNKASLSFRIRHYWSQVQYNDFYNLKDNGELEPVDYAYNEESYIPIDKYNKELDINYNAFTLDMTYIWNFAPGSELSLVWKNSIYSTSDKYIKSYYSNIEDTFNMPNYNRLSVIVLY